MQLNESSPILSVIIVSFNTRSMTLDCLRTLYENLGGISAEVFLVDNASKDGSAVAVREGFPEVNVFENPTNIGFGAANNIALAKARGKYLLLLNTDAFPLPGAISKLIDCVENYPEVGVVGPRLLNGDGSLQSSCFRFPTPLRAWIENLWISRVAGNHSRLGDYRSWSHDTDREVDFVIGACLLVRREVYLRIGGFDERYFMYQEEADWQRRVWDAGWKIMFLSEAKVTHLGGASGKDEVARINRHFFESLDLYELKHHGRLGFLATRAAMLVGCAFRGIIWALISVFPERRAKALGKLKLITWLLFDQLLSRAPNPSPASSRP